MNANETQTSTAGWVREQDNSRNATIKRIKAALKNRSGKSWSVTGGKGTAWGWITITAPPSRREGFGYLSDADTLELTALLGLPRAVHTQGENIPSGYDYYGEYIDRAEGRTPTECGQQYWD